MLKIRYINIGLLILILCSITLLCLLKFNPFSASIAEKPADSPITSEKTGAKKSLTAMEALLLAYEEAKKVSQFQYHKETFTDPLANNAKAHVRLRNGTLISYI